MIGYVAFVFFLQIPKKYILGVFLIFGKCNELM